jgi:hypothetical protein
MRFYGLTTRAMLVLSEYWLQQPFIRSQLRAHDLGLAIRARLREVYGDLTALYAPHLVYGIRTLELAGGESPEVLAALSRRVYEDLAQRLASATNMRLIADLRQLMYALFPDGLRGPNSLSALAGARASDARELRRHQDEPWFTRLRTLAVDEHTLMDAYRAWATIEDRSSYQARKLGMLDVSGRTIDAASKVREKWLCIARGLYTAVALLPWDDEVRDRIFELLAGSLATVEVQASRGDQANASEPEDTMPGTNWQDCFDDDEDTLEFDERAFGTSDEPACDVDAMSDPG